MGVNGGNVAGVTVVKSAKAPADVLFQISMEVALVEPLTQRISTKSVPVATSTRLGAISGVVAEAGLDAGEGPPAPLAVR